MGPENGMNPKKISYFSLLEYVERIKLTNQMFNKYLKELLKYDNYAVIYYWIDSLYNEIINSQKIEHSPYFSPAEIKKSNVFFDTLHISHSQIKKVHQFVTFDKEQFNYRTTDVRVSSITPTEERIFFWGVNAKDLKLFMNDFIEIYRSISISVLHMNPFLKSALIHLLFVRIHPFIDGNGRTARMLHNIKFTELINQLYNMKLKISPLNLSSSILINQPTYVKR